VNTIRERKGREDMNYDACGCWGDMEAPVWSRFLGYTVYDAIVVA
jgi:hypothetical protein